VKTVGLLFDYTKDYDTPFNLSGGMLIAGGLLCCSLHLPYFQRRKNDVTCDVTCDDVIRNEIDYCDPPTTNCIVLLDETGGRTTTTTTAAAQNEATEMLYREVDRLVSEEAQTEDASALIV